MKIEIESTTKMVQFNDVPARVWEGKTASGIPVHCYITMIAVKNDLDSTEFHKELREHRLPSPGIEVNPLIGFY